jgi:branched-subunit amino acid aminotransferase/4-amino-4-deoxychorismate lyase
MRGATEGPASGRTEGRAYCDGRIVRAGEAALPATGEGVLFGRGLFETIRVSDGRPELLDRHVARMIGSLPAVGIDGLSGGSVEAAVEAVIGANALREGAVRVTCLAAPEGLVHLLAHVRQAASPTAGWRAGIAAVRRNETSPLASVKSVCFLDNVLAREEARRLGFDEALMLNSRGELAEGCYTNLFVVREGRLLTPPVSAGALPGIVRGIVLESAARAGVDVSEEPLTPDDLFRAGEAFLTNSLIHVAPLVEVDGRRIGDGRPGPMAAQASSWVSACANGAAGPNP